MPRIRKKTSNRTSTNDRRKLQNKVREGKKRKAKAAKKNPQWKSKHKKDPGIPNNYPYKDQILAEIQAQRVQAAEEKAKRKEKQKEDVSAIAAQALDAKVSAKPVPVEHEEDEEAPLLLNHELQNLKAVLDQADAVIEVLDCRDPQSFRSSHLEEVANKKIILLLNKIDSCPQEAVSAWLCHLRRDHPTFLFRSASAYLPNDKGKAKAPVNDGLGVESLVAHLSQLASGDDPLTVAVVGLTNTGKSSFINTVLGRSLLPIYTSTTSSRGPTTTEFPQEVSFQLSEKYIRFIDTPGLLWEPDPSARVRDVLMRNRGRIDRIKDPMPPVEYIVKQSNTEDLMLLYNLPAFPKGDVDAFVAGVARSSQLVKKRGVLDLAGACRVVLRDWNIGKLKWYTMPTESIGSSTVDADDKDKPILSALSIRKEMRKAGGLVRFTVSQTNNRKLLLENAYHLLGDSDSDGHSSESDQDVDADESDGSGVETGDGEDSSAEEEEVVLPVTKKRKRAQEKSLPPTSKRVSFAPTHDKKSKSAATKSSNPKSTKVRRAANVPSSARKDAGGDAYDFGKFF